MTNATTDTGSSQHPHLTQKDEMSLADEQSAQTRDSDPDTLEVRDDSNVILQGTMNDLRRPLLIAVVVVGTVALLAVSLGALMRRANRNGG
jgi:hypothetical protein